MSGSLSPIHQGMICRSQKADESSTLQKFRKMRKHYLIELLMREKKMICIDYPCDSCIHQRENIDGWKCACDAFPDGTPDWIYRTNIRNLKECNNGIGYEKKSDE